MKRRNFLTQSITAGGSLFVLNSSGAEQRSIDSSLKQKLETMHLKSSAKPIDLQPARWIWYPSQRTLQNTFILFRKQIDLRSKPVRAAGWILADSRYEFHLNGKRVQWGPTPCDPRWVEVDPFDLTGTLQSGPNVLACTVLFFGQGDGTWPTGKPGFILKLEIEYRNGERQIIVSDSSWVSHLSRAHPPGHYKRWYLRSLQEEFDARLYPTGWTTIDFQLDESWLPAMELNCPSDKPAICSTYNEYMMDMQGERSICQLRERSVPLLLEYDVKAKQVAESCWIEWKRPVEEYFECLTPDSFQVDRTSCVQQIDAETWQVNLTPGRAAAVTFEFEEQIVGWPFFTIHAPEGTIIELLAHEAHEVGGPALLNTHFNSWTRFICREGGNEFHTFDYESLRWLQLHLHGREGAILIQQVGVKRRIYPWPNPPQIQCSEPKLQRLFDAAVNTLHNCAQETVVDGMARERQQYSGDCGHALHAIYFTFGEYRQPARFLTTFSQGLTQDGYFLDCWPAYDRLARLMQRQMQLTQWGPLLDHGVGFNFDCYHHYLYTGDLEALAEPYPRLLRFAEYLHGILDSDGLLPVENIGIPAVWIDHDAYRQQRHKQCAFNLYAAAMFQHALAAICKAFGDHSLADEIEALGRSIQNSAIAKFWSDRHRLFVNNLPWINEEREIRLCDRSLATSILFDQCPNNDITNAAAALVECPPTMGFSYPANAGWRLWALGKAGRQDVILNDFRTRWASMNSVMLNNTLQEGWNSLPDSGAQWSHCPVAPLYILFMSIVGIKPLEPGFRRCEIRPQFADLRELKTEAFTIHGPIHIQTAGERGGREITIQKPSAIEAELVVPEQEQLELVELPAETQSGWKRYRVPDQRTTFLLKTI